MSRLYVTGFGFCEGPNSGFQIQASPLEAGMGFTILLLTDNSGEFANEDWQKVGRILRDIKQNTYPTIWLVMVR